MSECVCAAISNIPSISLGCGSGGGWLVGLWNASTTFNKIQVLFYQFNPKNDYTSKYDIRYTRHAYLCLFNND